MLDGFLFRSFLPGAVLDREQERLEAELGASRVLAKAALALDTLAQG
jgi:hypothetical protein